MDCQGVTTESIGNNFTTHTKNYILDPLNTGYHFLCVCDIGKFKEKTSVIKKKNT